MIRCENTQNIIYCKYLMEDRLKHYQKLVNDCLRALEDDLEELEKKRDELKGKINLQTHSNG